MAAAENSHAEVIAAGQHVPVDHLLCGLAENPALPSDLVDRLVTIADEDIAVSLAGRADLTRVQAVALVSRDEEIAARLAEHPHAEVRRSVAANEATPPAVLAALLTGEYVPGTAVPGLRPEGDAVRPRSVLPGARLRAAIGCLV
ncbi:hypothetical protein [Microbispora sitophila]|uniref:hypothetical protein n=1 Tax=Microbispora sitophila TaxID=2771537 RepID=UPI001D018EAE|nr:hypothetical protein [Microbispora sitophila]